MTRPMLLFALALGAGTVRAESPLPPLANPAAEQIDAVFGEWDRTDRPGCSLGVYRDGKVLYARGYGMANLEHGIANTPDTVFRIASTSKQFTAAAVALLAEEGALSLDADLHEIFPELPDYGTPPTVRQLVHHTSGVRDYLTLAEVADWGEDYTTEEALRLILAQRELNFPPGERFLYSNSGYFLLSQVVERVTGQTLREWAAEHLFGPLGMSSTHFHDDHTHIVRHRADGYSPSAGGYRIDRTVLDMVGDGGVFTTVEDLARWDRNFVDNRLGGGPELLRSLETPGRLTNGDATDYAFGLSVGEHRGARMISHGGAFVGFRATTNRFPDQHLSVAVLCNVSAASPGRMALEVADLYLAERLAPLPEAEAAAPAAAEVGEAELRRLAGHYWNAEEGLVREVALADGRLVYVRSPESRNELAPLGDDRFRMLDAPAEVEVRFAADGDAGARQMTLEVEGDEPTVLERFEPARPSVAELAALAGDWYSGELDAMRRLTLAAEGLVLEGRLEDAPLRPVVPDVFAAGGLVLRFRRVPSGEIAELLVDAGRVRNLRFVRRAGPAG